MIQNVSVAAKAVQRWEFIVTQVYLRKHKKISNNLTLCLKQLSKKKKPANKTQRVRREKKSHKDHSRNKRDFKKKKKRKINETKS